MIRRTRWPVLALAVSVLASGCGDDGPTRPATPEAPAQVAVAVEGTSVLVTWAAVPGATSYDVQRRLVGEGAFATVAPGVAETSYTDDGLAPGTYDYRVLANNGEARSPASDPATAVIAEENPFAELKGTIQGQRVLSADTVYTLEGVVLVADGASLTLPAGTLVYGSADVQPTALIVQRGGRIFSEGTADDPVVFTSPKASPEKGDWGGVVINGRSICNFPADDCVGEGLSGPYGGERLDDDSGRMVYTRIEWAGFEVSFGNELNALTLNGVGSGTEIHHVQTHGGLDDGFEWFGGTVDAKYLLATDISDDSFDFSTGWHGRGQFWLARQDPDDADTGYEVDGNEDDPDAEPWTNPRVYNVTLVGKGPNGAGGTAGESTTGMLLRRGAAGTYANHIVTGFGTAGVDLDQAATVARIAADSLSVRSSIFFGNATDFATDPDDIDEEATMLVDAWGNRVVDPGLADPFDRNGPDFRPVAGSPATTGFLEPPGDGFFEPVDFIGAVGPGAVEWYREGWTRWGS